MRIRTVATGLAVACALGACGGRGSGAPQSSHPPTPRTTPPPAATAAVTTLLTAVFAHPQAAQCTSAMTPRYVSEAFTVDAARSGTSPPVECREHQRLRARLPEAERRVTVPELRIAGGEAHATVRGSNGYPVAVALARDGGTWRLDGSGVAAAAPGRGKEIAPVGSLYAYRVPPGLVTGRTAIGPVLTTGSAFSTSVGVPGGRPGEGIVVAQGALGSGIHTRAALRAAIPRLDHSLREVAHARVVGAPLIGVFGGRLAVSWDITRAGFRAPYTDGKTVIVFSSAANIVVVNCHWPQTGADLAVLRNGCNAVLATLSVG